MRIDRVLWGNMHVKDIAHMNARGIWDSTFGDRNSPSL